MKKPFCDAPDTMPPPHPNTVKLEAALDKLCALVTKYGPEPIVRGMPSYLVHERIVACIENLANYAQKLLEVCERNARSPEDQTEEMKAVRAVLRGKT